MGQALIARCIAMIAVAFLCLCVAQVSVGATVAARHIDAPDTYLHALYVLVHGESTHVSASVAAIKDEAGSIDRQCPSSLADVPGGDQLMAVSEEVRGAIRFSLYKPYVKMMTMFGAEIGGFRSGDRTFMRLIRLAIHQARAVAMLAIPDVCADIAAWTGSDNHMLPADTAHFANKVREITQDGIVVRRGVRELLTERILEVIKLRESSSERSLIARVNRLEAATSRRVARAYWMATSEVAKTLY